MSIYFIYLITNCKNNAFEELHSNMNQSGVKKEQDDLRTNLENAINDEAQGILEKFLEAAVFVKAMECSKTFLCGLTISAEMQKRFRHYLSHETPEPQRIAI